jgi:hypothetical protein
MADKDYEERVTELETQGLTRSDAQSVADAELLFREFKAKKGTGND